MGQEAGLVLNDGPTVEPSDRQTEENPPSDARPALASMAPELTHGLRRSIDKHRAEFRARLTAEDLAAGATDPGNQYARACDGLLNSLLNAAQAALPGHRCWATLAMAAANWAAVPLVGPT